MPPASPDPPQVLLAMLKAPRAGFVKTRLAREIGAESAAAIYRALAERQMSAIPPSWRSEVHVAPADGVAEVQAWLGPQHSYHAQTEGDLGCRLTYATAGAFQRDAKEVIIVGGDCPGLDAACLREAAGLLHHADVVLGPALDGGYYLIGLARPAPQLFVDIPWSSSRVLATTMERIAAAGLKHAMLAPKEDIDDLASLRRQWPQINPCDPMPITGVSVIIPTLDESEVLPACLASIRAHLGPVEVVAADGGSRDGTRAFAEATGAIVITAPRGRGVQCRAGAERSTGDWLLFLHADSVLQPEAAAAVEHFTGSPNAQIATFHLRFADGEFWLNAWARLLFFDSVFTRFGDQGILVRRSFYEEIGGFPPWPLFEDVSLLQRARARTKIHWLSAYVATSARRFRGRGLLRQKWLNAQLLLRYLSGASPDELAARYSREKGA